MSHPFDFADITTFGLGADNRRQVHYLLTRLTAFVGTECEQPDRVYFEWERHPGSYLPALMLRSAAGSGTDGIARAPDHGCSASRPKANWGW